MNSPVIGQISIVAACTAQAQEKLDAFAQARGYTDIVSLCSYANDPDPTFAAEGLVGVSKRSQMWAALRRVQSEAIAGQRSIPRSFEELEVEAGLLPSLTWGE